MLLRVASLFTVNQVEHITRIALWELSILGIVVLLLLHLPLIAKLFLHSNKLLCNFSVFLLTNY